MNEDIKTLKLIFGDFADNLLKWRVIRLFRLSLEELRYLYLCFISIPLDDFLKKQEEKHKKPKTKT